MLLSEFDYALSEELIAQEPCPRRDGSRLLVLDRATGKITHRFFSDIPSVLDKNDLLVINDTRVIPARLQARKRTGGKIEMLLIRRLSGDPERWLCMAQATKGIKQGTEALFPGGESCLIETREGEGHYIVKFSSVADLERIMSIYGETPLPPYIHRLGGPESSDPVRYQTVYAREPGSCAAPTAGLHFTEQLLTVLAERTAGITPVTLHVGPGTFLPVRTERVEDHKMHEEWFLLEKKAARRMNEVKKSGGRIVAVGTTAVRVLEHSADREGMAYPGSGMTGIFITPGYRFKAVDRLITNFHLPRSTLLMLVCALAGKDLIMRAYAEAVREKYRFYSFGDAMLIL